MNVSFNWLDELASLRQSGNSPSSVAERLTTVAAAVDSLTPVGTDLEGIVAARVLSVERHPNADRLSLCRIDRGDGEILDVVCGAPVIVAGGLYPHAAPGTVLPGGFRLEKRRIRGQMSLGMLCSEDELKLGRDRGGIMRLADDLSPGDAVAPAFGLPDVRLTLDLNPNRVDLACHIGVARELSPHIRPAPFGPARWEPEWIDGGASASCGDVTVTIKDGDRCPRYMAAIVRGVKVAPSPAWLAGRLLAAGARPISNVVDATNYVLLERNQPLHAFDLNTVGGSEIRIRAAAPGEQLVTLDGEEHRLATAQTVIADRTRAIALAGVMGGRDTEVTEGTTDVLIECAAFEPMSVRRTRSPAGLSTDASYRFERGIDRHAQEGALIRCVELILAVAGGTADPQSLRVGPTPSSPPPTDLRVSRTNRVLGFGLGFREVRDALTSIGFGVENGSGAGRNGAGEEQLRVYVPGWRTDVTREIDLIEEVARRVGYDAERGGEKGSRPSCVPEDPRVEKEDRVRRFCVREGFLECRSTSFMPEVFRGSRADVRIPNPLSSDESCLRAQMIPVLLRRLEHNFARGHRDVRLFEIGTVFGLANEESESGQDLERYVERGRVGILATGRRSPGHWDGAGDDTDLWDLKGVADVFSHQLCEASLEPGGDTTAPAWLAGSGFNAVRGGRVVGVAGQVRQKALDAPPWAGPVFAMEFDLDAVRSKRAVRYVAPSHFPEVRRDLAVLVGADVQADVVETAVREAASDLLESVELFDVYAGDEVGAGRKSLGWTLRFRARDRTLTDREVEREVAAITRKLGHDLDASVRGA